MSVRSALLVAVFSFVSLSASAAWQPGLNYGSVSGAANWTAYPTSPTNVLGPMMATTTSGWGANTTYVYWGQIYLDGSRYNFAESIDDGTMLVIDGETLIKDTAWNKTITASIMRPAGWYSFEVRFYNGGSGAGPANQDGWGTTAFGFGYNKNGSTGKASSGYTFPMEPGDLTLFRYDDGTGFDDCIEVSASPEKIALDGLTPGYGFHNGYAEGASVSLVAPAGTFEVAPGKRATCIGWKLYRVDAETSEAMFWREGEGNEVPDYEHPDCGTRIVWQWKIEYLATIASVGSTTDEATQWVEAGKTLAVTATASAGYDWLGWHGTGVTAENRRAAAIEVTVDGPVTLTALASPQGFAEGTTYYVADYGNDANDGLSWATPKKDLVATVAASQAGDGVLLADGALAITNTVTLDRGVKVRGVARDFSVITGTNINMRAFTVKNDDAEVSDLTINGITFNADKNRSHHGLGFNISKGYVHDCRIVGNNVEKVYYINGKGVYISGGRLSRVIIEDCTKYGSGGTYGGGLYMTGGTADNILVRNCACQTDGGGIWISGGTLAYATVYGCTSASGKSGGIYINSTAKAHPYVYNCISYGNTSTADVSVGAPEWYDVDTTLAADRVISFAAPAPLGTNPVTSGFDFVDAPNGDLTYLASSSCIDAGTNLVELVPTIEAKDLNGVARPYGERPDIGCYEFSPVGVQLGVKAEPAEAMQGNVFTFIPAVYGVDPDSLEYSWTVTGASGETFTSTDMSFTRSIDVPDWYTLTLEVKLGGETVATYTRPDCLHVGAFTNYVATTGSAKAPYSSPATAATSVQDAIDEALPGAVVLIAPGTYTKVGEVSVAKGIRLLGAGETFDDVILRQTRTTANDRVLYLSHPDAVVSNVTLTGGCFASEYSKNGIGALIDSAGGTITHCHVTGNQSKTFHNCGAGVSMKSADGVISHCKIDNNSTTHMYAYGGGVWASKGLIDNCLICNNTGVQGGGVCLAGTATMRHCTVVKNYASEKGGGIQLRDASGATVIDTVFDLNEAPNDATTGAPEWHNNGDYTATFTKCMWPEAVTIEGTQFGVDSYSATPTYEDAANNDFRMTSSSPTMNKGVSYDGMAETDFYGNPRLSGTAPDIGCFEIDASAFTCSLSFAPKALFTGETATLTPSVLGVEEGTEIEYAWVVDDGLGHRYEFACEQPAAALDVAGWYQVTVTASVDGVTAGYTAPESLHFAARTNYLAAATAETIASAAYPWDTPATAHTNLNELIDETIAGSVIIALEGVHRLSGQVDLSLGQRLYGAGMDRTVFKRLADATRGRFFYINHEDSLVEGVTLDGAILNGEYSQYGMAVWIGANGGTLAKSRVVRASSNTSHLRGAVGVTGAKGLVDACYVNGNTNKNGYTESAGISLTAGRARNCLVYDNYCVYSEGGAGMRIGGSAMALNCTVVSNYNTSGIGGVYISSSTATYRNCLICGNRTGSSTAAFTDSPDWYSTVADPVFENCYFSVNPTGVKPQTGDVRFKPSDLQPYGLDVRSPCRNKGVFVPGDWPADPTDLSGLPRIHGFGKIDIGCFECSQSSGMFLQLR